jgi:hypothetical protein
LKFEFVSGKVVITKVLPLVETYLLVFLSKFFELEKVTFRANQVSTKFKILNSFKVPGRDALVSPSFISPRTLLSLSCEQSK